MKILLEHHCKFWKNYKPLPHKGWFHFVNPLPVLTQQGLPRPLKLRTSLAGGWDVIEYTAGPPLLLSPTGMHQSIPLDPYQLAPPASSPQTRFLPALFNYYLETYD